MHLCLEHLCGRRPGLRGLTSRGCSLAFGHRWALRGLDCCHPKVRRKKGPALPPIHSPLPLFSLPGLRAAGVFMGPSAGVSPPVLASSRPERGLLLLPRPPVPLTHTSSWLGQGSPGHRMAPEGSAVSHFQLEGSTGTTGRMPPDTAPQACGRLNPATCCFCSFLSSHPTRSAEALPQRPPG